MADLSYASDHILDERFDSAEACDVLATTLPDSKSDLCPLSLDKLDIHVDMADVLIELTTRALDGDETRLDADSDALRHG